MTQSSRSRRSPGSLEPGPAPLLETDPHLGRREVLTWLGAAGGAALLAGAPGLGRAAESLGRCVLTPRQTEGPYFVDERLERQDLRASRAGARTPGAPLKLALQVVGVDGERCLPLPDAIVDVWHCDAQGRYSDVQDPWLGSTEPGLLRGFQRSDARGEVRFVTIYPGWYPGRAVHVHFKVRARDAAGRDLELTSQLYFDDAVTERAHRAEAYARPGGAPPNGSDGIFRYGGESLTLTPRETASGYTAEMQVGLRL